MKDSRNSSVKETHGRRALRFRGGLICLLLELDRRAVLQDHGLQPDRAGGGLTKVPLGILAVDGEAVRREPIGSQTIGAESIDGEAVRDLSRLRDRYRRESDGDGQDGSAWTRRHVLFPLK